MSALIIPNESDYLGKYEVRTYDKRVWLLNTVEFNFIRDKMQQGKKILIMPDTSMIALGNIASISKAATSTIPPASELKILQAGRAEFDPDGPGYKKYMAMKAKLRLKSAKSDEILNRRNK
jgi:hypothetical protein